MRLLIIFLLGVGLWGCAHTQTQDPMLGAWENATNGDIVGLHLYEEGKCEIYIERAFQNRTNKACKYEPFKQQYVVFLVKADGSCGSNPDFEFDYDPNAPLVRLYIQGSPMILSRVRN